MTQLAARDPEHIELAYVTPAQLLRNNRDRLYTVIDPTSGERTLAFKVGDWFDTGLLQVHGQRGLYLPRTEELSALFGKDGRLNGTRLPHWQNHVDPNGKEALRTPLDMQNEAQQRK